MHEPIDIYAPAGPDHDPRAAQPDPPGIRVRPGPPLHPDDLDIVQGIPCTSVSRTLIDIAEVMDEEGVRRCFVNARDRGLLDDEALRASRARVEWRPSLALIDRLIEEFAPR